jgi:hypothetical protein
MKKDAKTPDVDRILKILRSLGTGGLLGGAAGIGAYVLLPSVHATGLPLQVAAGVGAAVGTALHRAFTPVLPCLNHYRQMAEIQTEVWLGLMPKDLAEQLRTELQLRYFLGERHRGARGSPLPFVPKQPGRLQRTV